MHQVSERLANPSTAIENHRRLYRLPKWVYALALLVLLTGTLYLFRAPILISVGNVLVVRDDLGRANLIVLLTGDFHNRPKIAAQLIHEGWAQKVLVSQVKKHEMEEYGLVHDNTALIVKMLEKFGVPEPSIVILKQGEGVTSTFEEALGVRHYLEQHTDQRKFILVTSAFHTRRARWIFRKALDGLGAQIQVAPVPYGTFDVNSWWRGEDGLIYCFNEYVKLIYYWLKY